jgi:hypothetical protein
MGLGERIDPGEAIFDERPLHPGARLALDYVDLRQHMPVTVAAAFVEAKLDRSA